MVRQRRPPSKPKADPNQPSHPATKPPSKMTADQRQPLPREEPGTAGPRAWNQWVVLAIASGGCAAFNGVFAKLTTTQLTTDLSQGIAKLFGLAAYESIVEVVVRCMFFGLNLIFNGVMWTFFTAALSRGNSTTQVSIMNTSSNFVLTALLGFVIFSESLPPMWWLGAAMLVVGNVVIGRNDESKPAAEEGSREEGAPLWEVAGEDENDGVKEDDDVAHLGNTESDSEEDE